MTYTINRLLPDTDVAAAEERVRAALAAKGFGVLTEIDVAATMKKRGRGRGQCDRPGRLDGSDRQFGGRLPKGAG